MPPRWLKQSARLLANSAVFRPGRQLFAENLRNWNLPLSKFDKLRMGSWLILEDYSKGVFPPQFLDQRAAYQAEKDYFFALPGMTDKQVRYNNITKPFWPGKDRGIFLNQFSTLVSRLQQIQVEPPAKILELGCGGGWMAEFLATMGYDVCGTTISEIDIADAGRRIKALAAKEIPFKLRFVAAPMETIHETLAGELFDAAFVYEALHHAYDWRETIQSAHKCLRANGWLLICNEPNLLHTCISYRVAKLTNTHEIGFRKRELVAGLRQAGFRKIISTGPKWHWWFRPHWLLAQKQP